MWSLGGTCLRDLLQSLRQQSPYRLRASDSADEAMNGARRSAGKRIAGLAGRDPIVRHLCKVRNVRYVHCSDRAPHGRISAWHQVDRDHQHPVSPSSSWILSSVRAATVSCGVYAKLVHTKWCRWGRLGEVDGRVNRTAIGGHSCRVGPEVNSPSWPQAGQRNLFLRLVRWREVLVVLLGRGIRVIE